MKKSSSLPQVKSLSAWYLRSHRDLPWRKTQDPYRIWISEIMLQQTQVATVLGYYERFLASFPTLTALAKAPTEEVLELWSGLGYYSRARNLQKGARYVLDKHAGRFPRTREQVLAIPGIGPYTAGAVLSIAFDLPAPIVDGNVQRVLTRYYGWMEALEKKQTSQWLWQTAEQWVNQAESPRVLNQALMELGAMVCRKESPRCDSCPIVDNCQAFAKGLQAKLPARNPRRKPIDLWWGAAVVVHKNEVLLCQQPEGQWWHGLWSTPVVTAEAEPKVADAMAAFETTTRLQASRKLHLGKIKHTVTHHRLHVYPTVVIVAKKPKQLTGRWVKWEDVDAQALSSLARKVLRSSRAAATP